MKNIAKNNSGITMITSIITIVVMIIIAAVAMNGSSELVGKGLSAKETALATEESDKVRALLRKAIVDKSYRIGIELSDTLAVIGSEDKEYGKGYYLIPGGTDDDIAKISRKVGEDVERYEDFTASFVVDYDEDKFERVKNIKFKNN